MKKFLVPVIFLASLIFSFTTNAQTLPGDTIVYGPMFSPVYNGSVRVWVLTSTTGSGNQLSLDVKSQGSSAISLAGKVYNSDTRLGYMLRSYEYAGLVAGESYLATVKINGKASDRKAAVKNDLQTVSDFSFLSGGCGRIYDTSRCIDRPESLTHKNGDPEIFNRMAQENSDMMVWLGDATYLLGLQHAAGQCPGGIDDWANKDTAFARYMFYRKFHDKLTMAMPQLAITDNHDTGPNEFNKTMPTLGPMKETFMNWWPNPQYLSTPEGQGLFSSYKYKDIEYFLLDNRSYRNSTTEHLGPEQLDWLKRGLQASTATFKILVSGTPVFDKHWGGRNFSITAQADDLIAFIQNNNIDGVLALSADIHEQQFYGRYNAKYPLFDVMSGNLNSDVGNGNFSVDYNNDIILHGVKQTYLKVSVIGPVNDRRMKVQYVALDGKPYFETNIHSDMLKSKSETTRKLALSFSNNLMDSSSNNFYVQSNNSFGVDRNGKAASAAVFNNSELKVVGGSVINLQDRTYSLGLWIKPTGFGSDGSVIFSNALTNKGITFGLNAQGYLQYNDHATGIMLTSNSKLIVNQWTNIVWKYDNVKRILALYVNGMFAQQWTGVISSQASPAEISLGNNFQNKPFAGSLDDVELNGKLLSDEEIKKLAAYQSNRSNVLLLDGAQNMLIPADSINPTLAGDFTIEFWARLKADPGTNFKILASNSRVNGNSTGLSFEFPDSNRLNVVIGNNSSSWNGITEKGNPWKIGEWNHVAVSAVKNGSLVYYVNGEKLGETVFGSYIANPTGLGLGDSPYYAGDIRAEMDELRIWNSALNQASIKKHMHYPLAGAEANLIFYYDFNALTTTNIVSKGSNKLSIPLTGASITSGTAPVADLPSIYKTSAVANWSAKIATDNGFYLNNAITDLNANLVVGKESGESLLTLANNPSVTYLNAGWIVNTSNISSGAVNINLTKVLTTLPAVLDSSTTQYFFLVGDLASNYTIISAGKNIGGGVIQFANIPLSNSVYHLAWVK